VLLNRIARKIIGSSKLVPTHHYVIVTLPAGVVVAIGVCPYVHCVNVIYNLEKDIPL